jgi:hypothetical protein
VEYGRLPFTERFGFVIDFEQMFSYRCGGTRFGIVICGHCSTISLTYGIMVILNKVEGHAEVVVNLASIDFQLRILTVYYVTQWLYEGC